MEAIMVDGTMGEGGGQTLRTALTLSAVTGKPTRVSRIRGGTPTPGLSAADLVTIRVVGRACGARVGGAELGSFDLTFVPDRPRPVELSEAIEGAGAVGLILQAAAIPLALAAGSSRLTLTGGTHVFRSPTYDFLETDWLPAMEAIGLPLSLRLHRAGYHPEGGGEILALIPGNGRAQPISRPVRSNLKMIHGMAWSSRLPKIVPERIAREARRQLRRSGVAVRVDVENRTTTGEAQGVHLVAITEDGSRSGFSMLGDGTRSPERIARDCVNALFGWLDTGAAVSLALAEQILIPLALADGPSVFTTSRITLRLLTTAELIHRFLPARITVSAGEGEAGEVRVKDR